MAIFLAAASKAIKSIDEITVGMELWEGSWQFRPGSVGDKSHIVTHLPIKFGETEYNEGQYTNEDSMYHEYIIRLVDSVDKEPTRIFCMDNNVGWGENASYNDHFLFRTKEDAEEFVKSGAALLETDPNVITAFALQEIDDMTFDAYDDYMDDYDPNDDIDFDFNFDDNERF